jgi:hypothetical protein
MDIEATCSCGARVKLLPLTRKATYGHDSVPDADERVAVATAFREWVQAHSSCGQPPRSFEPYREPFKPVMEPFVEPTL